MLSVLFKGLGEDQLRSASHQHLWHMANVECSITWGSCTCVQHCLRRAAAAASSTYQVEQLLLRKQQPRQLTTYLVFPGLIYGSGEADSQLHGHFRQAWENEVPLEVWGSGSNCLPTVCLHDLASWCVEVALQQPAQQVVVAVDGVGVQQRELVAALSQALGSRQGIRWVRGSPTKTMHPFSWSLQSLL